MMRQIEKVVSGSLIVLFILFSRFVFAQNGTGGVNSLFTQAGVGSRALALGNAYVACAKDPSVVYWNPAALDFIEKKSASFYYSNLIAGSSSNFLGVAFPTTNVGSFGFGWIRIGTDDLQARDESGNEEGQFGFSQQQFLFSYGRKAFSNFSFGLAVKIERFILNGINLSDTGFGSDFGFYYQPEFDSAILRDLTLGLNIQNLIRPQSRLQEKSVPSPVNFKIGFAKPFLIGAERSAVILLFDVDKSEDAPSMYHVGAEYSFHDQAMLRFGVNDGNLTFGAGASYENFHFDYSFGKLFDADAFSGNHRFTITVEFGKSKSELIQLAKERRDREVRRQLASQLWFSGETTFNSNMEEGREKYYGGDYLSAYAKFQTAEEAAKGLVETAMRLRGEINEDAEANLKVETANSALEDAQTMLALANAKYDSVRKEEKEQVYLEAQKSTIEEELRDFIIEHREKGNAFFKEGEYTLAIREWQLALDRITSDEDQNLPQWMIEIRGQLENDIKTAEDQLTGSIKESIKRADNLARRGDYVQALNILNEIRASGTTESEKSTIEGKIRSYQSQLTFKQSYDQGLQYYASKEWQKAMNAFERALQVDGRHAEARRYYEESKARALAKVQEMPPAIQSKWLKGLQLYRNGEYAEALKIWEEIRKEQPYNKRILDSIDSAREKLKQN